MLNEDFYYSTQTRVRRKKYKAKLERYQLGLKCRAKWLRRRGIKLGFYKDDPIYSSLFTKCVNCIRILQLLKKEMLKSWVK